ncbi:MAG: hypothetical protein R3248_13920 [Candidatus Promineifilaceae bacterium]|nr:hypothetical protein [Candidatus Promineifilaceae bacterium]
MSLKRVFVLSLVSILALAVVLTACGGVTAPVEPAIVVEPTSGGAGTEVVVSGEGFPAEVEISIRLGPPDVGASPLAYATTTTTERGVFATSFVLPERWPDEAPIVEEELLIIALIADGSVKATARFDYEPLRTPAPDVILNPENGEPGERVEIVGANFLPGMAISLRLSSAEAERPAEEVAQVVSDEAGGFRTVIAIPVKWSGSEAAVREQELVVAAVSAVGGQTLAQATFFNVGGKSPSE